MWLAFLWKKLLALRDCPFVQLRPCIIGFGSIAPQVAIHPDKPLTGADHSRSAGTEAELLSGLSRLLCILLDDIVYFDIVISYETCSTSHSRI
jgi:hypothetical protein